jgi:hypothetical protein
MTFSSVEQFDDLSEGSMVWPLEYKGPEFPGIIFENTARGCTIVLNGQARDLINIKEPTNAIMHDWWILLLLQLYGSVKYESRPEIRYRLHAQNFIGVPNRRMLAFVKTLKNGRWLPLAQLQDLLDYPNTKFKKVDTFYIELFAKNLQAGLIPRLRTVILSQSFRYRRSLQDEIKVRFGLVFLRILNRKGMKETTSLS